MNDIEKNYTLLLIAPLMILTVIFVLYLHYIWVNTQGNKIKDKLTNLGESIYSDNVKISWLVLFFATLLLLGMGWRLKDSLKANEIWVGVFVEMFGMIFDILLLVLLFNWITAKGERKKAIDRYLEEISDLSYWKSEEAKFRIRGNILRLNQLGITKLNLSEIDMTGLKLDGIKINGSILNEIDFTNSNMNKAELIGLIASSVKFNEKKCFLHSAKFMDSRLQYCKFIRSYLNGADFTDAKLSNINFSGANLKNIIFNRTYFYDPEFEGAEVDKDFLAKIKNWNITGNFDFTQYEVLKKPVPGYPGRFEYFLHKKHQK